MFTGIVTGTGRVRALSRHAGGMRLHVVKEQGEPALEGSREGDSVCVSGVCLTMLEPDQQGFSADVSAETLAATTLGHKSEGDIVNLELALRAGDRFGGHMVSGHVDAPVALLSRSPDGDAERFEFALPQGLERLVSRKGSVCLDGVSLTVNAAGEDRFGVCIIPHTLQATTLGALQTGQSVNLEVDMIARYLERLLPAHFAQEGRQ